MHGKNCSMYSAALGYSYNMNILFISNIVCNAACALISGVLAMPEKPPERSPSVPMPFYPSKKYLLYLIPMRTFASRKTVLSLVAPSSGSMPACHLSLLGKLLNTISAVCNSAMVDLYAAS